MNGWEKTQIERRDATDLLLTNIKSNLEELERLLEGGRLNWNYEDPVYRFWHYSFKVYGVQGLTLSIVDALEKLLPERKLNPWFTQIVAEGTGREFQLNDNDAWLEHTRPMMEAFFHARFMLEMAVKYGKELDDAP